MYEITEGEFSGLFTPVFLEDVGDDSSNPIDKRPSKLPCAEVNSLQKRVSSVLFSTYGAAQVYIPRIGDETADQVPSVMAFGFSASFSTTVSKNGQLAVTGILFELTLAQSKYLLVTAVDSRSKNMFR